MADRKKKGRDISGILILDKPLHISSNRAVQIVKRLYGAKKVGHTGSLDPLASGVLPICLGHATKVSQYLLASDKTYQFTMKLGQTTTTGDVEGDMSCEKEMPNIDNVELSTLLQRFTGKIQQIPPMYSALKHNGRRLYALARQGQVVERAARDITIKSLTLQAQTTDTLSLEVCCTKGTYIRTLAEDIGEALGCGAHVTFLRRIITGPFGLAQAVTLEQLEAVNGDLMVLDGLLNSLDLALKEYPVITCTGENKKDLCLGRQIHINELIEAPLIRLNDTNGDIFGLGKWVEGGQLAPVRIFA
ncbi:MAG TPA: tRNA pseudouridine(55) synthase TruB [Cycloclasticus sp.]|jgi:tRNA pseudouridine55 synthase|nr:tRNA pseudouridine(55) synthase TruB [Cycloclasticus sp.]HIL92631.1 tRNA pseudouridine(55) synthase TruB [Cycloclasticus sp.]